MPSRNMVALLAVSRGSVSLSPPPGSAPAAQPAPQPAPEPSSKIRFFIKKASRLCGLQYYNNGILLSDGQRGKFYDT